MRELEAGLPIASVKAVYNALSGLTANRENARSLPSAGGAEHPPVLPSPAVVSLPSDLIRGIFARFGYLEDR
jgi:hypothetical protein